MNNERNINENKRRKQMTIIYIISIIMLFVLEVLLKKTDKKLEIVKTLTMTIIIQLAYNAFVCYILNLLNIPITLINLSIVNYIISAIILIGILKNKKIQKYELERKNIIVVTFFILLSIVALVFILRGESKIRYLTGDPENHYTATKGFASNTYLSNNYEKNYYTSPDFMIMGYVNEGIICKMLSPYIGTISLFNIYLAFEVAIYALTGITFYFIAQKYCKEKYHYVIALIFSLFYILGYPLNAWITGFHYLVIGMLYIQAILYAINEIKIDFKFELILMCLLNFGLIFSYCLFCPAVYLAEFIYFIYKYIKKNKKELILMTIIALIIPGIMGTGYILIANFNKLVKVFSLEGYIYKNLWSNFIIFIPFVLYNIYDDIKNKKVKVDTIMIISLVIYIISLYILKQKGKCSAYYFSKNYFVLWILTIEMAIKGIIKFTKKRKI